ncbi:MAG: heme-binding protein [Nitrospirota bacterium]
MASIYRHKRRVVPTAYRFMIVMAFVMLMPYTVPASDDLTKESVLPLSLASKAVQASLDVCKVHGYKVSVAVVDRAGVLRALVRADGAGSHTVDSSGRRPIRQPAFAARPPSWLS